MIKVNSSKGFLVFDMGGTWIKGSWVDANLAINRATQLTKVSRTKNTLSENAVPNDLVDLLQLLVNQLSIDNYDLLGVGISTSGIVNYHGSQIIETIPPPPPPPHLKVISDPLCKLIIEAHFNCPLVFVNDADASAIGLSVLGYLHGNKSVGIMPVGTGLGFTVWKNGRRWRPSKSLTLLGSILSDSGSFNLLVSTSILSALDENNDLKEILKNPTYYSHRSTYLKSLANAIFSAAIIYNLDEILLCGGLASAAVEANFNIESALNETLRTYNFNRDKPFYIKSVAIGNALQLIGAAALVQGEFRVKNSMEPVLYEEIKTEKPYNKSLALEKLSAAELVQILWSAEQEAGISLQDSLPLISQIAERSVSKIKEGGRIIYVGSGTSGRIAAMDAIEIPCTFGFPEDKIITLISGGIADASIEIEKDFEEDASSIPEILLLNLNSNDIVIGISASGSSHYVRSALVYAKFVGALSVFIHSNDSITSLFPCDFQIPLHSGNEVVAGSTRMKAGTSTKKVLNFFSTSVMILLGKVVGPYMVDMACINNKLIERAQHILTELYGISKESALEVLEKSDMILSHAITKIQATLMMENE